MATAIAKVWGRQHVLFISASEAQHKCPGSVERIGVPRLIGPQQEFAYWKLVISVAEQESHSCEICVCYLEAKGMGRKARIRVKNADNRYPDHKQRNR